MPHKPILPWNEGIYGEEGALTQSQKNRLMERFPIDDPREMDHLSQKLGESLHPRWRMRSLYDAKSALDGGPKLLKDTYAEIGLLAQKVERLGEKLDHLHLGYGEAEERHALQLNKLRFSLPRTLELLTETRQALSDFEASGGIPSDRSRTNKRRAYDEKIEIVFNVIFDFCERNSWPLTYTTNPQTSERTGQLVEFANEVVACITRPSEQPKGETVRRQLTLYRKNKKRWAGSELG